MATAAPLQAQPAPMNLGRPKGQRYSVDATVLAAKLKALQLEEVDNEPRPPTNKPDPSKRASYVPRNAAKVFAATTTPAQNNGANHMKRAKSLAHRQKPVFAADGKPCINPKQLHAALSLGMSENEAVANIPAVPGRRSGSGEQQRVPSGSDKQRRLSESGYKPGDAAKRNAANRRSLQPLPQGKHIAVMSSSHPTQESEVLLGSGSATTHSHHASHAHPHTDPHAHRPVLRAQDRPNWAQQSQCGEEMHHFFRHQQHHPKAASAVNDAEQQAVRPTHPQPPPRQRSLGAIPENLVTEAVKQIKSEERGKRRRSLVCFFRRS
ncbi:hypothetical protein B0A55_10192 [Friedmanniomyces simplex]|uniref:Uncharacterized protein n=1 Tax=Friedmanniomyces simplex TaxID=329884 RepID=A0A4U0WNB8_9PEZI|nr:hypothetical protein B0A55_10192 [Friedmanniomyces simplex]